MVGLPSMEHTFKISVKGTESGRTFEGEFTYRRPRIKEQLEADKWRNKMAGDAKEEGTSFLYTILSMLRFNIVQAPEWWDGSDKGMELYDLNVILAIYEEIKKFETKWREEIEKNANTVTA
jgi:hypothetical protein